MMVPMTDPLTPKPPRHYRWPWFLIAGVILGVLLMILWMLGAVRKVKRIRESTTGNASLRLFANQNGPGFSKKGVWPADAKEVGVEEPR
jgi:hypothetical protein